MAESLLKTQGLKTSVTDLYSFVSAILIALALYAGLVVPLAYVLVTRKSFGTFVRGMTYPLLTGFGILSR